MKVNEIFYSLQGEGCFTGTPAVFLRLSGCNRACHFCDTDFKDYAEMTDEGIIDEIRRYPSKHIVITGGEPAMQITYDFIAKLKRLGYFVQIETNGSLPVPDNIDWITCSPKAKPWNIQRVDELKIVYQSQDVESIANCFKPKIKSLQPCSGLNNKETIAYILDHPDWRLSIQTHKLLDIR